MVNWTDAHCKEKCWFILASDADTVLSFAIFVVGSWLVYFVVYFAYFENRCVGVLSWILLYLVVAHEHPLFIYFESQIHNRMEITFFFFTFLPMHVSSVNAILKVFLLSKSFTRRNCKYTWKLKKRSTQNNHILYLYLLLWWTLAERTGKEIEIEMPNFIIISSFRGKKTEETAIYSTQPNNFSFGLIFE